MCVACALLLGTFIPVPADGKGDDKLGLRTVCIDAGHGGTDPGCVSKDRKTYESSIALDIAKRLQDKVNAGFPNVKTVMTRSTDVFVTLAGRAEIANKNNADLFISIHVNMASSTSANGYSIHTLGQSSKKDRDLFAYNMDVCKRENSVIMLEDDYSSKYQGFDPSDPESFIFFNLMQNAYLEQSLLFAQDVESAMSAGPMRNSRGIWQDPFYVLWKTAMPAVLIEVGFMSNATDLATLRTEAGREKIAQDIYNAFATFKKRYDGSVSAQSEGGKVSDGSEKVSGARSEQDKKSTAGTKTGSTASAKSNSGAGAASKPASNAGKATSETGTKPVLAAAQTSDASKPKSSGNVDNQTVRYGMQVLASARVMKDTDPFFKGYVPVRVKVGNLYKYIIGVKDTKESAKAGAAEIRRKFDGAFLVEFNGESVKIVR